MMNVKETEIIILCKGSISHIPPVLNSILVLLNLGKKVKVVCGAIAPETEAYLKSIHKDLVIVKTKKSGNKLLTWHYFRKKAWSIIKESKDSLLWVSTGDTSICLGPKLKKYKYVQNVLELYDNAPFYRYLIGGFAKRAQTVVVPEYNRACILRIWWKLKKTPCVIANKPYITDLTSTDKTDQIIKEIQKLKGNRRVVLYQGLITSDRNLDKITEILYKLKDKFLFVLMGSDFGYVEKLKNINSDLLYIPSLPAPIHQNITEVSDIGVVVYHFNDLNNIYCAPNKIWEYSCFEKPMLGSDIPGLKYTIETSNSGICVNPQNSKDIEKALKELDENFDIYSEGAKNFYQSISLEEQFKSVFDEY